MIKYSVLGGILKILKKHESINELLGNIFTYNQSIFHSSPKDGELFELKRAMAIGAKVLVLLSDNESTFEVKVNGTTVKFYSYALKMMIHCMYIDGMEVTVVIEEFHWKEMRNALSEKSLFIDIGAATGTMCVPFQKITNCSVIAFEANYITYKYLKNTVSINKLKYTCIENIAISDRTGTEEFIIEDFDTTFESPWAPEHSRLNTKDQHQKAQYGNVVEVKTTTLNDYIESNRIPIYDYDKIIIKIDIEGFEEKAIMGATVLLELNNVELYIDIHIDPFNNNKTTLESVSSVLKEYNFRLFEHEHVLIARKNL